MANSAAALIAYIARCVWLHNNYQIEDELSYVVDEKIDINDQTYISKFLSHIIIISCQSTDIIRSITHFQYFLAIFCLVFVVILILLSFSTTNVRYLFNCLLQH